MTPEELKERTTAFAINILDFSKTLRSRPENWEIARQLSDAATSVASNYRAACRARSRREFIAKLGIAVEEADESLGWLQIVIRGRLSPEGSGNALLAEAQELLAILVASRETAKRNDPDRRRHR